MLAILGATLLAVAWFFVQEGANGRFDRIEQEDQINESWLREHILKHPAEVVGAAWDDRIGKPEVVALLARMSSEGKLQSDVSRDGLSSSMTLRLKVDRSKLTGYERKLVDALFYDGAATTSTEDVKEHYKKQGFNPVAVIQKELEASVHGVFPPVNPRRTFRLVTLLVFAFGLGTLVGVWYRGYMHGPVLYVIGLGSLVLAAISTLPGNAFRSRMTGGASTRRSVSFLRSRSQRPSRPFSGFTLAPASSSSRISPCCPSWPWRSG